MREFTITLLVAIMLTLAAGNASAQAWCDPCNLVLLPIIHAGEVAR